MIRHLLPLSILLVLTGCVTNKGWQGLVPGKDIQADVFKHSVVTPWGHSELQIEGLRSWVNPDGSRTDVPLEQETGDSTVELPVRLKLVK